MTANRKSRVASKTRKDILRFAPNFTAYVLPPDVVCLYSEDRKFFLHGELYCALATAIGKNGKAADREFRRRNAE
jgi:ribosomal protein S12 methylthiotransferase accessory factor